MPETDPTYDSGFRQAAVHLLISSQRLLKAVAAERGVSANSLLLCRTKE
jgi:transposase-like protein